MRVTPGGRTGDTYRPNLWTTPTYPCCTTLIACASAMMIRSAATTTMTKTTMVPMSVMTSSL